MTLKPELFPGAQLPTDHGNIEVMSDGVLLSRLRRAVQLYRDPAMATVLAVAPKRALAQLILDAIKELRGRGYEVTDNGDAVAIYKRGCLATNRGEHIEILEGAALQRRVYWALSDAMDYAQKKGDGRRRAELFKTLDFLRQQWNIVEVSREKRTIRIKQETSK